MLPANKKITFLIDRNQFCVNLLASLCFLGGRGSDERNIILSNHMSNEFTAISAAGVRCGGKTCRKVKNS